jgi:hypothetical protein
MRDKLNVEEMRKVRKGIHYYHIFVLTVIYYIMLKNVEWVLLVNFVKNPMEWTMSDYLSLWDKSKNKYYYDINMVYLTGNLVLYGFIPYISMYSWEYFCTNLFWTVLLWWNINNDDVLAFLFLYMFTNIEMYLKYLAYYGNSITKKIYEIYKNLYIREFHYLLIAFLFLKNSI